jgi:hypothetical protein
MAQNSYSISDADVGRVLDPPNGWVTNLRWVGGPTAYEVPVERGGKWVSGYFVLRGERDHQAIAIPRK